MLPAELTGVFCWLSGCCMLELQPANQSTLAIKTMAVEIYCLVMAALVLVITNDYKSWLGQLLTIISPYPQYRLVFGVSVQT